MVYTKSWAHLILVYQSNIAHNLHGAQIKLYQSS